MSEMDSSTSDNVVEIGGGGRIYRDSRDDTEQRDPEVPPMPVDGPKMKRAKEQHPSQPASVMKTVQPPPEPKAPYNWRESISTALEFTGLVGLSVTGFFIALWVGLLVTSICFLVVGVAISHKPKS